MGVLGTELLDLVREEVERTASRYEAERLRGGSLSYLPLFITSIDWSHPLPELSIPEKCVPLLSELYSCWGDNQIPLCTVDVKHILLSHSTLEGNTFPLVTIGDHNGYRDHHRLSEKGCFANVLCTLSQIRALGNILAVGGLKVSESKTINGLETYTVVARAPFEVGWYLNRG